MDIDKVLKLLQIVHKCVGVGVAGNIQAEAYRQLAEINAGLAKPASPVVDQPELDLSGKPVEIRRR